MILAELRLTKSSITCTSSCSNSLHRPFFQYVDARFVLLNIAQQIRETINKMNNPTALGLHLHSIAFEKSPQRICQGISGQRNILVSAWARAGLYDVDFGLSDKPIIRYADAVIPDLNGQLVIKEAPPSDTSKTGGSNWTENGVDISIRIRTEDMKRLVQDPMLLP